MVKREAISLFCISHTTFVPAKRRTSQTSETDEQACTSWLVRTINHTFNDSSGDACRRLRLRVSDRELTDHFIKRHEMRIELNWILWWGIFHQVKSISWKVTFFSSIGRGEESSSNSIDKEVTDFEGKKRETMKLQLKINLLMENIFSSLSSSSSSSSESSVMLGTRCLSAFLFTRFEQAVHTHSHWKTYSEPVYSTDTVS